MLVLAAVGDQAVADPGNILLISYLIVAGIGIIVGIAEIASTFSTMPMQAFSSHWAWLLILLNGGAAALVLWAVNHFAPGTKDSIGTAVAVGLGLPTLIRTKFTVAKQLVPGEEGSSLDVNFRWLYDQFQTLFKNQIDLSLVMKRERLLGGLLKAYPKVDRLVEMAHLIVQERALLTEADIDKMQKYVDGIASSDVFSEFTKRLCLARFILDTGGPGYVAQLIKGEVSTF